MKMYRNDKMEILKNNRDYILRHLQELQADLEDFSNEEFFNDLPRRVKEIEELASKLQQHSYTYAASDDLGGIGLDQLED